MTKMPLVAFANNYKSTIKATTIDLIAYIIKHHGKNKIKIT